MNLDCLFLRDTRTKETYSSRDNGGVWARELMQEVQRR